MQTLWKADLYDENSRLQQTIAANFLAILKKKFPEFKGHLLDIGCGTGRITPLILKYFPEVSIVGIDASKEMIDFAQQHFADSRTNFIWDRAEELKRIDTNSVDAIVSFSCLHWVHDLPAAFRAIHRVLKPGGWIGLMFAAETGIEDQIDNAYAQAMQEAPWKAYFVDSPKEVGWSIIEPQFAKAELEKLGFEVVFMDMQNFDFPFKDVSALESWILACSQQLKLLPLDLQTSCSRRIAELYLQATASDQPPKPACIYKVDAFMLIAQKPE